MRSHLLDDAVRHFVSEGTGIPRHQVIPGFEEGLIPGGEFVSVTAFADRSIGGNNLIDVPYDGIVWESGLRARTYSVEIFREGAFDNALRFDNWTRTHESISWAENALSDGRIWKCFVIDGGRGCIPTDEDHDVVFHSPRDKESTKGYKPAKGKAVIENGVLVAVYMVDFGAGFTDNLPEGEIDFGFEEKPKILGGGAGFAIESVGLIREMTPYFSGEHEERANFEMGVAYGWDYRRETQFVDEIQGNVGGVRMELIERRMDNGDQDTG